tara:strand:- start:1479 stop:1688 length:210 start_codon:yes stop_codon:yes gene_type:complete
MIHSQPASSLSPASRSPREEEQFLCNEALRTGDFDAISDSEWIALCERAAGKVRHVPKDSELDEEVSRA